MRREYATPFLSVSKPGMPPQWRPNVRDAARPNPARTPPPRALGVILQVNHAPPQRQANRLISIPIRRSIVSLVLARAWPGKIQ